MAAKEGRKRRNGGENQRISIEKSAKKKKKRNGGISSDKAGAARRHRAVKAAAGNIKRVNGALRSSIYNASNAWRRRWQHMGALKSAWLNNMA